MNVYTVTEHYDYEGDYLLAIFTNKRAAEAFKERITKGQSQREKDHTTVDEYPVAATVEEGWQNWQNWNAS